MKQKTFDISKGKGKNKVVQQFTVKNEEDINKLGTFLYCGWTVKESCPKKYDVYERKNLLAQQMREEYRNLTGLDNDGDFTDDEIHQYLLEAYKESETAKELKKISVEIEHFNGSTYFGFMLSIKDDGTVDVIKEKDCSVADIDGDYIFGTENDLYRIQADEPISRITYEEIWNCYNDLDSSNEE